MSNATTKLFINGNGNFILEMTPEMKVEISPLGKANRSTEDTSVLSPVPFDISFQAAVDNAITLAEAVQIPIGELQIIQVLSNEMMYDFE